MKLKYRLARASNASNRNRPRSVAMHRSGIFDSRSLLGGTITIYIRGVYLERAEREEEASGQRYPFIWVPLARVKPITRRLHATF